MTRITETVKQLLIINALFFFATQFFGDRMYALFALWFPENENFYYFQVLTYMFMHGGFFHILFNMYALWAFGSVLEQSWGRNRFIFFYLSAGVGSAIIHTMVNYYHFETTLSQLESGGVSINDIIPLIREGKYNPMWQSLLSDSSDIKSFVQSYAIPAVGASGAIYGLLVAFAMMFPNAELFLFLIPIPIKAKYFITGLIALDLLSGLTGQSIFGGNIAHFAHVGGALFGFVMMWYWQKRNARKNRWDL